MPFKTSSRHVHSGAVPAFAATAGLALCLSACAAGTSPSGAATSPRGGTATSVGSTALPSQKVDSAARALLPESIRTKGEITAASELDYPPEQFLAEDNKTVLGYNPDMGRAIAQALGVKITFVNTNFDAILAGVISGRYDIELSGMSDTPPRQAQVTFVDYMRFGNTILVSRNNPHKIATLDDTCGLTAAVGAGETYGDTLKEFSNSNCVKQGKKPITVRTFQGSSEKYQSLLTGRADFSYNAFDANAYEQKQSGGQLHELPKFYPDRPYGIAVKRDNPQLAQAIKAAIEGMIRDGSYQAILSRWGIEQAAIGTPTINDASVR